MYDPRRVAGSPGFMEIPNRRLTLGEFLDLEVNSEDPLEYVGGYAVPLTTPGPFDEIISGNLSMTLGPIARSKGFRFFAGDAKIISSGPNGIHAIPDFVITGDPSDLAYISAKGSKGERFLEHPWLVIEIISPNEKASVVGRKRTGYKAIKEETQYVQIDSQLRTILVYERLSSGKFEKSGPVERLVFPRLDDIEMSFDDVFRNTLVPQREAIDSPHQKGDSPHIGPISRSKPWKLPFM